ncbi:MAG: arylesterase [Akkermansiaceae bacterium]|nr:arylesterase [Verrucomicrobiales bacterium]
MNRIGCLLKFPALLRLCLGLLLTASATVAAESTNTPPAAAKCTIVVLGDSLAAGNGVDPEESFPAQLQQKIDQQKWNFTVVNAGLSGDTSAGGLRRIQWLLRQQIDVLILELGGNDGLRGLLPGATKTNLQAIIDRTRSRYPNVQIVIAGMKMPPNMGEDYRKRFEQIFDELARSNQAALVPFLLEGVGGRADMNQDDRIHPTAEGQRVLAENVWRVLQPLLERMVSENATAPVPVRPFP